MSTHPKTNFSEVYILAPKGCCLLRPFTCAREWPKLANSHPQVTGSPSKFLQRKFKNWPKIQRTCAFTTLGLWWITSQNVST